VTQLGIDERQRTLEAFPAPARARATSSIGRETSTPSTAPRPLDRSGQADRGVAAAAAESNDALAGACRGGFQRFFAERFDDAVDLRLHRGQP
jgi:hypothetical protein